MRVVPSVDHCDICGLCGEGERESDGENVWCVCVCNEDEANEYGCKRSYHVRCAAPPRQNDVCFVCTRCDKCGMDREGELTRVLYVEKNNGMIVNHTRYGHVCEVPSSRKEEKIKIKTKILFWLYYLCLLLLLWKRYVFIHRICTYVCVCWVICCL